MITNELERTQKEATLPKFISKTGPFALRIEEIKEYSQDNECPVREPISAPPKCKL